MEDILEEIIGEFYDEKDVQNEDVEYQQINKNTYVFEGKTNIIDFLKILSMEDNSLDEVKKESETIAGLLLENLGAIPQKNTKLSFPNLTFEVISVDKRRIKKIKVIVKQ
jgi:CBS domain containing-hemolysin-like protein